MNNENRDYSWPGWSLKENPFGKEFDLEGRKRMIKGSRLLLPLLRKYPLGKIIVEAGPFFNPLINEEEAKKAERIIFLDNDPYVLNHLKTKYTAKNIQFIRADLNNSEILEINVKIDSIIVSHLLNYIDYNSFLQKSATLLKHNGLIFINNSIDYGLPFFFSDKRPKSSEEITNSVVEAGFEIIERIELPTTNKEHQPHERLLLVAKRK